jgi:glutamate racemase
VHLVITDSGLGGLSVCALVERTLRETPRTDDVRITYVNVWPEQGRGYNDLPDPESRARVFDRALQSMAGMHPDLIVIACNTLSILYGITGFHRTTGIPVQGIVDAGVELFHEALSAEPHSTIVLMGTRTTIESGVHRRRLLERGVQTDRVAAVSCHGLAKAIEHGPASSTVDELIERCTDEASSAASSGDPLFVGLCCTHYGMVADAIAATLAAKTGCLVGPLDPNERLARDVMGRLGRAATDRQDAGSAQVRVVSKVTLDDGQREAIARVIQSVSAVTANALRNYAAAPDLF